MEEKMITNIEKFLAGYEYNDPLKAAVMAVKDSVGIHHMECKRLGNEGLRILALRRNARAIEYVRKLDAMKK